MLPLMNSLGVCNLMNTMCVLILSVTQEFQTTTSRTFIVVFRPNIGMVLLVLLYQQLKETVRKSIIMFVPVLTPMKQNQTELVVLHYLSIRLQLHHVSSLDQFLCVIL